MPSEGTTRERLHLDDNVVIEAEVEIVGFIDGDGTLQMKLRCDAEHSNYSSVLGLIEQAKTSLLLEWYSASE